MVRFSFAGHEMMALPQGALFWPARRALLVADLHLEKASWFAKSGQMLPPYDSIATLADLAALAAATGAAEIWCLGDSFHDRHGCDRLPAEARAMLTGLTAATRWTWIVGNHDPMMGPPSRCPGDSAAPSFADHCGGEIVEEAEVDGLILRHEADPGESRPELSGHFHPKLRITRRGRQVSRRCFVATATKLILPAFGALTGGLDAHHPEIVRAVGPGAQALVPVRDRLLRFPIAA
jgi:DNA ligase-associated metallophosphoesterase